jgi:hypothetical protein
MKTNNQKRPNLTQIIILYLCLFVNVKSQQLPYLVKLESITNYPIQEVNYGLSVLQNQFGVGLLLSLKDNGHLQSIDGTIGINHVWFYTNLNDTFDINYVTTNNAFFGTTTSQQIINTSIDTPFYLSFWIGGDSNASPSGGFYGWSKIERVASGLVLLDSAIAPNGLGIIVGTPSPIPEPSTVILMILGLPILITFAKLRVSS